MYILSLGIRLYMDMDMDMRKHLLHLRSLGGRGALRHAHACVAETQRLRRSSIKNQGRKDATPIVGKFRPRIQIGGVTDFGKSGSEADFTPPDLPLQIKICPSQRFYLGRSEKTVILTSARALADSMQRATGGTRSLPVGQISDGSRRRSGLDPVVSVRAQARADAIVAPILQPTSLLRLGGALQSCQHRVPWHTAERRREANSFARRECEADHRS